MVLLSFSRTALLRRTSYKRFPRGAGLELIYSFILSAFLVTHLLCPERELFGRISLPKFFARRALRIWPPAGRPRIGTEPVPTRTGRWQAWANRVTDVSGAARAVAILETLESSASLL